MKKKVLLILSFPEGGIGKHVFTICKALNKQHHLSLVTNMSEQDETFKKSFIPVKDQMDLVIDLTIKKEPGFSDIKNIITLYKMYKNQDLDIIHGHGAKGGLYSRLLGILLRTNVIYTPHGGSLHSNYSPMMQSIYTIIEKLLYRYTDKVIFESKYSYNIFTNRISNKNKERLVVNYNGIIPNKDIEKKSINKDDVKLSSFGLFRHLKGHDILIHAVSRLIKDGYNITLTIYGKGEERENLTNLIEELNMQKYIKLHPFVTNPAQYMLQSDILVHPSRIESLPYTPIEAMNLGIPVIVSNAGGLEEIVTDNEDGLVFESENIDELVQKIKLLIESEELYEKLVTNAHKTVCEKFNELLMCENLDKLYNQI